MLKKIEHIAIAVRDMDQAIARYTDTWGLHMEHRERVDTEKVDEAMLRVGDSYIQLLSPTSDDSTIARYLERRGEGIHHLAFEVDDVQSSVGLLETRGLTVIGGSPRPGSRGTSVAFIDPRSNGGVLVELVSQRSS